MSDMWRVVVEERGAPLVASETIGNRWRCRRPRTNRNGPSRRWFGNWKSHDAAELERNQIAHRWKCDGLSVLNWTEIFPRDIRDRIAAALPKNPKKWIYSAEIVFND